MVKISMLGSMYIFNNLERPNRFQGSERKVLELTIMLLLTKMTDFAVATSRCKITIFEAPEIIRRRFSSI